MEYHPLPAIYVVPALSRGARMVAKRDFTDRFLKSIKPAEPGKRPIIWDAQVPGFGIRVTDKCRADDVGSFVLVTRLPGCSQPTPRKIGGYPAMSLAQARTIARSWREDIRQGTDPKVKEAERQREVARRRADTFGAAFEAFADDHLSTLRTGDDVKKAIAKHVLPRWGQRPISDIRRADVRELVQAMRPAAPIGANRVLAYLKKFFSWAVDQDKIDASPATAVKRPTLKETKRKRVLTETEIRALWRATGGFSYPAGPFVRLLLLTGQRRREVAEMAWSEVDLDNKLWTIPAGRMKADTAHVVPLAPEAAAILESLPRWSGPFVFSTTDGRKPISGFSKMKPRIDAAIPEKIASWCFHDLRRSMRTGLSALRVPDTVSELCIGHTQKGLHEVYDQHTYLDEKRHAFGAWDRDGDAA